MTVKELKKIIEKIPDNMDIMIEKTDDEFQYNLLNSVTVKNLTFQDGKLKAKDKCLVLSDE